MTDWKGGRGRISPYGETTHIRIPLAIKSQVDCLSDTYKQLKCNQEDIEAENLLQRVEQAVVATTYKAYEANPVLPLDQALEISKHILKVHKKGARETLSKVLTALYGVEVSPNDLK